MLNLLSPQHPGHRNVLSRLLMEISLKRVGTKDIQQVVPRKEHFLMLCFILRFSFLKYLM